ncbi:Gfo/Idh/MocA family oxidoreductase [Panacibacter sp. DH6]|uniref:Gfo/Idh/MocA family oxidoreductase n=1 Tax=Panacibacter microcysteis TaxID=2793269 RepID=A0A931E2J0_9BACT|nr:Gfo/Idh/MocA family oxidoreductase [Panacibacter microcysteis]MBG9376395.1 Gfo/Idh/MocA family oxidoreductase [Panacibacter microcysteis]
MKRRQFLQNTGMFTAGSLILPASLHAARKIAANEKINIGAIGINGMGWSDVRAILKNPEAQLVAICDVDKSVLDKRMAELAKENIKPVIYGDYRKLLDDKNVDAVVIGTPDHWHCKIMVDAVAAGKDVYCEKPAGNSIAECAVMIGAQQKYNRVVQVGQWQRSNKHYQDAMEFVHAGKLGNVRLVKAWAYQGWMKSIPVQPDSAPPPGVDYDMWLGPAKKRPFNPNRFHFNFRWYWDYAGGLMTDWGVHMIDYALIGSKAPLPKSIVASGGKFAYPDDAEETPDTLTTVFEFNGFNLLWEHATGINDGPYQRDHGVAFIGNNGTLVVDRGGWEVLPETINGKQMMEAVARQQRTDNGLELHAKNFLDVIKSRKMEDLKCPIKDAAHVATVCQMGNVAFRTGKKIYWDADAKRFSDADANKYLAAEYHNGYSLPKV